MMATGDAQRMKDRILQPGTLSRVYEIASKIAESDATRMWVTSPTGRSLANFLLTMKGHRDQAAEDMISAEESFSDALEDAKTAEEIETAKLQLFAELAAIRHKYLY